MIICITGGRDYDNYTQLCEILDTAKSIWPDVIIKNGDARGADSLSTKWAISTNTSYMCYTANWDEYHRGAGHVRNMEMLESGFDMLIAFPGGKGTANMIGITRKANVPVFMVESINGR